MILDKTKINNIGGIFEEESLKFTEWRINAWLVFPDIVIYLSLPEVDHVLCLTLFAIVLNVCLI